MGEQFAIFEKMYEETRFTLFKCFLIVVQDNKHLLLVMRNEINRILQERHKIDPKYAPY